MSVVIDVKNLNVNYKISEGMLSAVEDVSFKIKKGEIFALIGESGCGKSTTAYSIMKLLNSGNEQVDGEILFNDKNLQNLSQDEMAEYRGKEIGMIFQNPLDSLNPVYTIGKQMTEAIKLDNISNKLAYEKALKLLDDVKIPDAKKRLTSFPHELSGGMRQRVMIGMMISRSPQLLIADEPTTALDVTVEAEVLQIIKQMRNDLNTSVLLITHNLGVVAEVADVIGVMYAGKIVEKGSVYKIFENPKHPYTKLLMEALPTISKHEGRLSTIPGAVPKFIGKSKGCRFSNRCPICTDICLTKVPELKEVTDGHECACHNLEVS